jgi:hypothetical protein
MQPRQYAGQLPSQYVSLPLSQRLRILGLPHDHARHVLHQVERRSQHVSVGAQQLGARYRDLAARQRADHPVLTVHVMGGGQDVTQRRPSQHPAPGAIVEQIGQIGQAACDQLGPRRPAEQAGPLASQVLHQARQVDPGHLGRLGHDLQISEY